MDADITFDQYLAAKLIDSEKFQSEESAKYFEYQKQFDQMHPSSFTAQKLFLINPLRRKYLFVPVENETEKIESIKPKLRPKIKR